MTATDVRARFLDARVFAGTGRPEEAWRAVREILEADPRHLGALLLKASLLNEDRRWEEALAVNEQAAALWPRSAEALNALARALHAAGRDAEALARAEEAKGLLGEPDNARHASAVYLTLVWCLREMRRYPEALAVAEEGLERAPDAILAQWATQVQDEYAESQKERC
ncbi:MAG TPA: tetratricopeptide repeat protein [Vicinamibacteria bacterium]|nr:tetratricopeptide repeat protein [Vicinamibacteria bacterium]